MIFFWNHFYLKLKFCKEGGGGITFTNFLTFFFWKISLFLIFSTFFLDQRGVKRKKVEIGLKFRTFDFPTPWSYRIFSKNFDRISIRNRIGSGRDTDYFKFTLRENIFRNSTSKLIVFDSKMIVFYIPRLLWWGWLFA